MKHIESSLSNAFVKLELLNYNFHLFASEVSNETINRDKEKIEPLSQAINQLGSSLEDFKKKHRGVSNKPLDFR